LEPSKFGPLDIAAALGVSAGATYMAAKSETFRTTIVPDKGTVSAVSDLRFIGGSVALLYGQLYADTEGLRRVLSDLSFGLLSSFFSTEVMRAVALKRMASASKMGSADTASAVEDVVDDVIYEEPVPDQTISYSFGF